MTTIENCRVLELPKIPDFRGNLSFVEAGRHVPFRIARTYWIYDVPGNAARGGHAYRRLEEFMIALSGSFEVRLDDGRSVRSVQLNRSYYGLYIAPGIWRELADFSTNSVCLVLAARPFEEDDYIREYDRFLEYRGGQV
ncbi:MAG: FdtA/QdtA family cupin domain-containing protein [Acidobacteriota bacterium]